MFLVVIRVLPGLFKLAKEVSCNNVAPNWKGLYYNQFEFFWQNWHISSFKPLDSKKSAVFIKVAVFFYLKLNTKNAKIMPFKKFLNRLIYILFWFWTEFKDPKTVLVVMRVCYPLSFSEFPVLAFIGGILIGILG